MTVLNGFYKASYKRGGTTANFYARVSQEPQIGRKTVVHEYPQSSTRYVQDNGKISGIYTLQVEINETTSSAYKRAIKNLRKVLETEGLGVLSHPELGRKKVVPTQSSRSANLLSENGLTSFTLTFMESDENKYPKSQQGNAGYLSRIYDTITGQNESYFAGAIDGFNGLIEKFNNLRDGIEEVTNDINDIVATINGFADEVAAITNDISNFQNSLTQLIQTPTNLSQRLNAIFGSLANITDNFGNLFGSVYGKIKTVPPTTLNTSSPQSDQINQNRIATNNFSNVAFLNIAYLASINITYTSQEQINNILRQLNIAFESIDPNTINEDIYYNLQNMRIQNRFYLESLQLGLPFNRIIYTNSIPSSILAYNIYGDSRRAQEIIDVNAVEDPCFVSGNVNVLSR
jgi:prophage DNA circulation protein